MNEVAYDELVLRLVESIPAGKVLTYGAIAEIVGRGGPRQVGAILARDGGGVPWWRVVRADGSLPPSHDERALEHYRAESTPMVARGERVDVRRAIWDGPELSEASAEMSP